MNILLYWLSKVASSIPRGFSKRDILEWLAQHPITGKEIIDKAIVQGQGKWRPSPRLIYPTLGGLLNEGLIEESADGRYVITQKGLEMTADLKSINNIFEKQLDVMSRIGNVGKFITMDLIDRISTIGSTLSSNLDKMTEEEKRKYKQFLLNELRKLQEQETNDAM